MNLLLVLAGVALAFPLNRPDPDRMEGHRCLRYPVGDANNVETTDFAVGETPPGAPVIPDALRTALTAFATDEALKKAARGRGVTSLPAVTSLGSLGTPVLRAACDRKATDQDDFTEGCKRPKACALQVSVDGKPMFTPESDPIGPKLSPIDSPALALGLVAIVDAGVFLPLSPEELLAWSETAPAYRVIDGGTTPWVEVIERPLGWLVRVTRLGPCGCEQDLVRRPYWVDRGGNLCMIDEPPVPVAKAIEGTCSAG
jgi:hypothetical protein